MSSVSTQSDAKGLDPVIEFYKQGVDRTLIRQNLRRSPEDRIRALEALLRFAAEVRRAGAAVRQESK